MDCVSMEDMNRFKSEGKLRSAKHPNLDLSIWNYRETVHFNKEWCPLTLMSRALVVEDSTGNIIGRSLPKFFNHTDNKNIRTDEFRIFDKLDGSLFNLFNYNGGWIFSSRGSFSSEQALKGEEIMKRKFPQYSDLNKDLTYVFELIYPENRIVVNYEDEETLKFITAFEKNGNEHLILDEMLKLGFETVNEFDDKKTIDELCNMNTTNKEGFVIRYNDGFRLKIKFSDYIELHKLKTGFSKKTVFDKWRSRIPLDEALKTIPDEFNEIFRLATNELDQKRDVIYNSVISFIEENSNLDKKDFYSAVKTHEYNTLISLYYNNKDPVVFEIAIRKKLTIDDITVM